MRGKDGLQLEFTCVKLAGKFDCVRKIEFNEPAALDGCYELIRNLRFLAHEASDLST